MGINMNTLKCDMEKDCKENITHIDNKGFIYCQKHGEQRKAYNRCRKLKPSELKKLQSGKPIKY